MRTWQQPRDSLGLAVEQDTLLKLALAELPGRRGMDIVQNTRRRFGSLAETREEV